MSIRADRASLTRKHKISITALKAENKKLRLDNKKQKKWLESYQRIFENSQDALLILKNRQFVDANNASIELLGYPDKEQLINSEPFQLSPAFQDDGMKSSIKEHQMMDLAVTHGSHRFEWTHLRFDGTPILLEVLLVTISTAPEESFYTIWRDISDKAMNRKRIEASEERFRALVESTSDFIWEVDQEARYTYASPKIEEILGYTPSEILGDTPFALMPEHIREQVEKQFFSVLKSGQSFQNLENINYHKNGKPVLLETSGVPFFNNRNELAGYRGIDRDITSRKHAEEQLVLSESVFSNSIEGIAITSPDATIEQVNNAFTTITGYSREEVLGNNIRILKSNRHDDEFYKEMWDKLLAEGKWSGEIWNRKKDGSAYPEWLSISEIRNIKGETTNYISIFHDISERKVKEEQLEFLAFHDPLTKLPNRRLFYDRLNISLQTAIRTGEKLALIHMDIDDFRHINDSMGHHFGDDLLCSVANRISNICRSSDTLARYGGDEFVIILTHLKDTQEALDCSNRLLYLFDKPISVSKEETHTSISIGISVYPDDGETIITLEKNSDLALTRAKERGKGQVYFFHKELNEAFLRRTFLINSLRRAVRDFSSFSMVYQPKVDAELNSIKSVEALIRWRKDGAPVSPEEFIPIAEDTNLIITLGNWILHTALSDMKKVHESGHCDISFSINLSTKQFNDSRLFSTIEKLTSEIGIDRSKLLLEITESAPVENIDDAIKIMKRFNTININFSMDDFGKGHSSLNNLKRFPLKELKIDRSFITDIPHNQDDIAISKTIINMAKTLGCQVVAEGVETEAQLSFLQAQGCHLIQGYLFYKPLPLTELLIALENSADL